ncbi:MAG TPA: YqaJ viral recombinase family protein [Nocardioidaceae bacterium]|nr:YqaJ viral recombinase family protein [Nocardioidaceae bacterium]
MTAIELLPPGTGPHDERWHELRRQGVTASEIAAVMGLSKWASPFSLFWQKVNAWTTEDSEHMSNGRHLEAAIADWWMAAHDPLENLVAKPAGLYAHPERPWQLATPDRLLHGTCYCCADGHCSCGLGGNCSECYNTGTDGPPIALLEVKWVASATWDGWGEPGTDDIPVYYRAQVLWQADVLGVSTVYVAALGPGGFRSYTVHVDERAEEDLRMMRGAGQDFHRRLIEGDIPDLDGHDATLSALSRLYPAVGEGDVQVSVDLAERYRQARADRDEAKQRVAECEAEIRAALGSEFNRAVCGKKLVASRSVFERRSDGEHELMAIDDAWPTTDRLNPGRASSYA